jgi:hypothetical protein
MIQMSKFVTEVDPGRREIVEAKLSLLEGAVKYPVRKSRRTAMAFTVGMISLQDREDPPITSAIIADKIPHSRGSVHIALLGLKRADLVRAEVPKRTFEQRGSLPEQFYPTDELYEAIAVIPPWQEAVRISMLSIVTNQSIDRTIDQAVISKIEALGCAIPTWC